MSFFSQDGKLTHIAIYAGTYDMYTSSGTNRGKYHFIIHVGNSRGPEISTVEYMADSGSKTSTPVAWYHLDVNDMKDDPGYIEVKTSTPSGLPIPAAMPNPASCLWVLTRWWKRCSPMATKPAEKPPGPCP